MISRLLTAIVLLAALAAPAPAQLSKDTELRSLFKPVVERASESTVLIRCNDKDTVFGTVVDPDGLILTKLSELKGSVYVRLPDGTEYEAATLAAHKPTDLALLKVDVKGLKPVTFSDTKKLPRGSWVAASGPTSDPVAIGIVSVMTRRLTGRDAEIVNPNRGFMGVMPVDDKDSEGKLSGAKLNSVEPGGAADKAGLTVGDVIVELNGIKIVSQATLREQLDSLKGGDVITVKAKRKDDMKSFKVTLGKPRKDRSDIQNSMGSELSDRRTGFSEVIETDMVLNAKQCGGPVVDLDGNVLGINIARAGRVDTWVLPSEIIRPLLPQFKAGKFAPVATTSAPALPVAPAPHVKEKKSK